MFHQFAFVFRKELLLRSRNKKLLVLEVLIPAAIAGLVVLLGNIQQSLEDAQSTSDLQQTAGLVIPTPVPTFDSIPFLCPIACIVGYTPNSASVQEVVSLLNLGPKVELKPFASNEEMAAFSESSSLTAGLVFNSLAGEPNANGISSYSIRVNGSRVTPSEQDLQMEQLGLSFLISSSLFEKSGFLTLQLAVDTALMTWQCARTPNFCTNSSTVPSLRMWFARAVSENSFAQLVSLIADSTSGLLMLAFCPLGYLSISQVVFEKSSKLKAGLRMMGLRENIYWLASFTAQALPATVSVALMMLVLFASGTFKYSAGAFIVVLLLAAFSLLWFCYFLSAMFDSPKTAGWVIVILLWFVLSNIQFLLPDNPDPGLLYALSLIAPIGATMGVQTLCYAEWSAKQTVDWWALPSSQESGLSVGAACLMMMLDCVLYYLFCLYLHAIRPGEFGVKLPWYFCFQPSYWRSTEPHHEAESLLYSAGDSDAQHASIEEVEGAPSVTISHMHKRYAGSTEKALDDVSLKLYDSQILGLLGHNGAGKSTLISVLTGLIPMDHGQVSIFGHSLKEVSGLSSNSNLLGVCPQHDVLYEELTGEEHVRLYAALKGVPGAQVIAAASAQLEELGLEAHAKKQVRNYSGGMRRRLSLAIALVGPSRLLCLDEPTSGLDLVSRQQIYAALNRAKKDRVIILTTHQLDEAELLCDRIAIMASGRLAGVGSSQHLKETFDVGYRLNLSVPPGTTQADVVQLVSDHIPSAIVVPRTNEPEHTILVNVPMRSSAQLPGFLRLLDSRRSPNAISPSSASPSAHADDTQAAAAAAAAEQGWEYQLTIHSLEDVFLKIAERTDKSASHPQLATIVSDRDPDEAVVHIDSEPPMSTASPFRNQLVVMIKSKLRMLIREKRLLVLAGIPWGLLLISLLTHKLLAGKFAVAPAFDLSVPTVLDTLAAQWPSLPLVFSAGVTPEAAADVVSVVESIVGKNSTLYPSYQLGVAQVPNAGIAIDGINASLATGTLGVVYNGDRRPQLALPAAVNLASNVFCRTVLSDACNIQTSLWPLPFEAPPSQEESAYTGQDVFVVVVALTVYTSGVAYNAVSDRHHMMRHQLQTAGMPAVAYLLAMVSVDMLVYFFVALLLFFTLLAFTSTIVLGSGAGGVFAFLLIALFYGASAIVLTHVWCASGLLTKNRDTASRYAPILHLVLAGLLEIASSLPPEAETLGSILRCLFPSSTMLFSLLRIASYNQRSKEGLPQPFGIFQWEALCVGPHLFAMTMQIIVYVGLAYWLDTRADRKLTKPRIRGNVPRKNEDAAVTVERSRVFDVCERRRAMRNNRDGIEEEGTEMVPLSAEEDDVMDVVNLTHRYLNAKTWAVGDVTFGVKRGECLGLLGPNGAGKSTVMRFCWCEREYRHASCGQVLVEGTSVDRVPLEQLFRQTRIGGCLQSDSLYGYLTVYEHLELIATIRQPTTNPAIIAAQTNNMMQALHLMEYANVLSHKLSGGNKRKLCAAMAIIGGAQLLLLDEPSTGVDPVSKRCLWAALKNAHVTSVLTTHSMEEAEYLSSRIAIMINGKLLCIGTPLELKERYGAGYTLCVRLTPKADIHQFWQFMQRVFPHAVLQHEQLSGATEAGSPVSGFKFSLGSKMVAADVFDAMSECAAAGVESFYVSQPSLEHVFLQFAGFQVASGSA